MAWNPHNSTSDIFPSNQQQQHSPSHAQLVTEMRTRSHQQRVSLDVDPRLQGSAAAATATFGSNTQLIGHNDDDEEYDDYASPVTSASASSPHLPHQQNPYGSSSSRNRAATVSIGHPGGSSSNRPRASTLSNFHPSPSSTTRIPSPAIGAMASLSATTTASVNQHTATGRRKRSRVTPEQLAYLERVFVIDRSPGAARRKEISELLGMQERQTQIWFQNRRAKAKMLESRGRAGGHRGSPLSLPISPPELGVASDADYQALIHAGEPITIISCTELTVGSWHRIASKTSIRDLIAYIAEGSRVLSWYIHSEGYGFRMEISFDNIARVDLSTAGLPPGQAQAAIHLKVRPHFYMEGYSTPDPTDGNSVKDWKQCLDWTEGEQASRVMKHEVVGHAVDLYHALERFPGVHESLPSPPPAGVVHLEAAPTYPSLMLPGSGTTARLDQALRLPESPSSAISYGSGGYQSPTFAYASNPHQQTLATSSTTPRLPQQQQQQHGRRRSFSGQAPFDDSTTAAAENVLSSPSMYQPSSAPFLNQYSPQTSSQPSMEYLSSTGPYLSHPSYSSYPMQPLAAPGRTPPPAQVPTSSHHQHGNPQSLVDYSSVPISNAMAQRPYSTGGQLSGSSAGSGSYNASSVLVSPFSAIPQHQDLSAASGYGGYGTGEMRHVPSRPSTGAGDHSNSLSGAMGSNVHTPPPTYPQHP